MPAIPKSPPRAAPARAPHDPGDLTEGRLVEVEAAAAALLGEFWKEADVPLRVSVFTEGAGVTVRERGGPQEPLYPHQGRLLRLDGAPVIEVCRALDRRTRRLLLAHALGHHVLGHERVPPEMPAHLEMTCRSPVEREATRFALALLLPRAALLRGMEEGWVSVKRLSEGFALPEACVRDRLMQLERHNRL
ncbi:MAG: ImmA/IrrE family metallo-endopeptidase [Mitsuaria chitosanitabida]|uniref:ImmA/IrrE family metallo-endopeptidase n=1 Tax=Roseateles chitosanitabidus TaxID=65048 RepID=UPI001B05FE44|nr:ImmA/IrrE family metallo-endopeptidase [Roseateles chitosanitabidus]MBO9687705.1 ImmA/IrrE family metallo-endopeptidase [Roseateles chitosanitabidus]